MNAKTLVLTLFVAVPLAAAAAPPVSALTVDCDRPSLPSQRAVAEFAGIANFTEAYAARKRLMLDAQRACKRGDVEQVRLVRRDARPGTDAALAIVVDSR